MYLLVGPNPECFSCQRGVAEEYTHSVYWDINLLSKTPLPLFYLQLSKPPPPPHFFLHSLQLKNIVFSWNPLKLCKTTHSWRVLPHFPSNSPLKIEILLEPTLFENLVVKRFGSKKVYGRFNPLSRKGGSHYDTPLQVALTCTLKGF